MKTTSFNFLRELDTRSKRLDNYSYKLGGNQYGMDLAVIGDPIVDASRMMIVLPFADGQRRDGVGDLLEVGGIRTERHSKNPVILFDHGKGNHKWAAWPIALAQDSDTNQYTVELDVPSKAARCNAFFYQGKGLTSSVDKDDERAFAIHCQQIFDLWANKFIRAGSIGYQVVRAEQLPPDYVTGTPQGLHLQSVLMLEASVVVMPANQDTVVKNLKGDGWEGAREILCMGTVCGYPLSPVLVKSLSAMASPKKAQMGYEGKALPEKKTCSCHGTCESCANPPLENVRGNPHIPPPKWKPGVGAVKAQAMRPAEEDYRSIQLGDAPNSSLRPQRKKKMDIKSLREKYKASAGSMAGRIEAGKKPSDTAEGRVQARQVGPTPKPSVPHDINTTAGAHTPGSTMRTNTRRAPVIRKAAEEIAGDWNWLQEEGQEAEHKDLHDGIKSLRQKYRTSAKGLRRRLKSSRAGTTLVLVKSADLDKCGAMAGRMGLKVQHVGFHASGHSRVKLIGDDNAADAVAKEFGRPIQTKSRYQEGGEVKSRQRANTTQTNRRHAGGGLPVRAGKPAPGVTPYQASQGITQQHQEAGSTETMPKTRRRTQLAKKDLAEPVRIINPGFEIPDNSGKERASLSPETLANSPEGTELPLVKSQPSDTIKAKGQPSDNVSGPKACQILKDGEANGHPLTEKQRGMFGAACNKKELDQEEKRIEESGAGRPKPGDNTHSGPISANPGTVGQVPYSESRDQAVRKQRETQNTSNPVPKPVNRPKPPKRGMKAMDQTGPTAAIEDPPPDLPDEPLGAQLVRRVHEDHTHLMQEYDSYLEHVEDDGVRKLMEKLLAAMDETMTGLEDFFSKHERYQELPAIEGAIGDGASADMDSDQVPEEAAGGTEEDELEEPTPEEAVEGMANRSGEKHLNGDEKANPRANRGSTSRTVEVDNSGKVVSPPSAGTRANQDTTNRVMTPGRIQKAGDTKTPENKEPFPLPKTKDMDNDEEMQKALVFYRRAKGLCPGCGQDPCVCQEDDPATPGYEENQDKPGEQTGAIPGAEGELKPGLEEHQDKPGEQTGEIPGTEDHKPGNEENENKPKSFMPYHRKHLQDGSDFLGKIGKKPALEIEDQMDSHHHGKMFKSIVEEMKSLSGQVAGGVIGGAVGGPPGAMIGSQIGDSVTGNKNGAFSDLKIKAVNEGTEGLGVEGSHKPGFEELQEIQGDQAMKPHEAHWAQMEDASRFFKSLAHKHISDFSNEDRAESLRHQGVLNPMLETVRDEMDIPTPKEGNEVDVEVGEMGEKSLTALKELQEFNVKQAKEMEESNELMKQLNNRMVSLAKIFSNNPN